MSTNLQLGIVTWALPSVPSGVRLGKPGAPAARSGFRAVERLDGREPGAARLPDATRNGVAGHSVAGHSKDSGPRDGSERGTLFAASVQRALESRATESKVGKYMEAEQQRPAERINPDQAATAAIARPLVGSLVAPRIVLPVTPPVVPHIVPLGIPVVIPETVFLPPTGGRSGVSLPGPGSPADGAATVANASPGVGSPKVQSSSGSGGGASAVDGKPGDVTKAAGALNRDTSLAGAMARQFAVVPGTLTPSATAPSAKPSTDPSTALRAGLAEHAADAGPRLPNLGELGFANLQRENFPSVAVNSGPLNFGPAKSGPVNSGPPTTPQDFGATMGPVAAAPNVQASRIPSLPVPTADAGAASVARFEVAQSNLAQSNLVQSQPVSSNRTQSSGAPSDLAPSNVSLSNVSLSNLPVSTTPVSIVSALAVPGPRASGLGAPGTAVASGAAALGAPTDALRTAATGKPVLPGTGVTAASGPASPVVSRTGASSPGGAVPARTGIPSARATRGGSPGLSAGISAGLTARFDSLRLTLASETLAGREESVSASSLAPVNGTQGNETNNSGAQGGAKQDQGAGGSPATSEIPSSHEGTRMQPSGAVASSGPDVTTGAGPSSTVQDPAVQDAAGNAASGSRTPSAAVPISVIAGAGTGTGAVRPGASPSETSTPGGPDTRVPQAVLDSTPLAAGTGRGLEVAHRMTASGPIEMRLHLATTAFGRVEMHTTVQDNQVGLSLASERGDLRGALSAHAGQLDASLLQHDLRLHELRFTEHGAASSMDSGAGRDGREQHSAHTAMDGGDRNGGQIDTTEIDATQIDTTQIDTTQIDRAGHLVGAGIGNAVPPRSGLSLHV